MDFFRKINKWGGGFGSQKCLVEQALVDSYLMESYKTLFFFELSNYIDVQKTDCLKKLALAPSLSKLIYFF